jgi:ATP-dependent DNA ligase
MPPVAPMLARATRELPVGDLIYEPKWDGFRAIVFRDADEVELGSRNERPLTRYFPDIVAAVRSELPSRCVLDGEIVVAGPGGLDFDALSQRIHPAESRVRMLALTVPASLVAFDLLALEDRDLRDQPFGERRDLLVSALAGARAPIHVTPATRDPEVAADWFSRFEGAGLDGVVAKSASLAYLEDKRVMAKVKHERTADFVVMGFRWYRSGVSGENVGSLLLGLYDGDELVHVGVIGSFPAEQRKDLVAQLEPYRSGSAQSMPGPPSRWNAAKDLTFEPLRPELVVEAAFEHLQGRRLRHTARFRRWRPDRQARSATFDQLDVAVPAELAEVFSAAG